MAKYYGAIAFSITEETKPGVWTPIITERKYSGDLVRNTSRKMQGSGTLNDNVLVSNDISIVADPFAFDHFYNILYVEFMGAKWKVSNVEIVYPRLILTLGEVYSDAGR